MSLLLLLREQETWKIKKKIRSNRIKQCEREREEESKQNNQLETGEARWRG